MDFEEWARYGWEQGWCGPPVCCVCDGVPVSDAEVSDERCVHIIRLYESPEDAAAVAVDHAPTGWRASNRGWTTGTPPP